MNRFLSGGVVLTALVLVCSNAFGAFKDGNKLVSDMREFERAERSDPNVSWLGAGTYTGYVLGIFDTIDSNLCISGSPTGGQVGTIVAKYLNEHPEEWNRPASLLVARALRQAFPCP
jgi:Rap1a immunity proteins